ncbi:hypothetical protein F8388_006867 [Cannabis sativa]|uniref:Transmembrane protein n=2 Tax=Cannabis sativa TaxID=3483 RepID=A0A7J6GVG3_CANSA|nr:hypothetical protein F8388_006867 [Cannabis sativa]KAF4397975.1 hypothetical protein G4B88_019696 [Cannabis sativa]
MMNFWAAHISTMFSNPLISSIVTLYALIFLYVPYQFMRIVFSPVLILTGVLLLTLLRLGAVQRFEDEHKRDETKLHFQTQRELDDNDTTITPTPTPTPTPTTPADDDDVVTNDNKDSDSSDYPGQFSGSQDDDSNWVDYKSETDSETEMGFDPNPCFEVSFVQWNLRGPLEVIYEEYEGDEEDEGESQKDENNRILGTEKQHTFSRYYHPDSDSDDSSDGDYPASGFWDSPVNMCFRWEEEDRDGLIEIALGDDDIDKRHRGLDFHVVDEDNLIEIDIYQTRSNDGFQARNDDVPPHLQASQIQLMSN